jgi:ferredoxin-type protein NapG
MLDLILDRGPRPASGEWPRPPGAVEDFLEKCTRCEDCVMACPHGSIGLLRDGTPALNPNRIACHLCEDLPCVTSCVDGALEMVGRELIFFGLARIQTDKCFVFKGPECGACKPACPVGALTLDLTKPVIDLDVCNGCGLCREACPVWDKAIVVDL